MRVLSAELRAFMRHAETHVELPARGVVAISGDNGEGKSSLLEAVAWAIWGESIRGAAPWREGEKTSATIAADGFLVSRSRSGGRTSLAWHRDGEEGEAFETVSKAQAALEAGVGPFDLWRRSHVFTSEDATHFSLATDGERKRLIEAFLGNDRFDAALEACRADLKAARSRKGDLELRRTRVAATLDGTRTRLADAKRALAAHAAGEEAAALDTALPGREVGWYDQALRANTADRNRLRGRVDAARHAGATEAAEARHLDGVLARLSGAQCPTCTQTIPVTLRASLETSATASRNAATAARAAAQDAASQDAEALRELEEEERALRASRDARVHAERNLERASRHRAALADARRELEATVQEAGAAIAERTEELQGVEEQLVLANEDVGELEACEAVLGMRGVRAMILGRALGSIEAVANGWLARMATTARVTLSATTQNKTAGTRDEISLGVSGLPDRVGAVPYRTLSQGERRRVDVALLLALSEVGVDARAGGTLWFDEVFDALDADGRAAVAAVLGEMAETRAVVVISHAPQFLAALPAAKRFRAVGGVLHEVER